MRHLALAMFIIGLAASAPAATQSQLERSVERDLRRLSINVDASSLTNGQLSSLHLILNSTRSENSKRGLARSVIGGRNSLRGVLFDNR